LAVLGYFQRVARGFKKLVFQGCFMFLLIVPAVAQTSPQIVPLNSAQIWQRIEFRVDEMPAASNPFDPEVGLHPSPK